MVVESRGQCAGPPCVHPADGGGVNQLGHREHQRGFSGGQGLYLRRDHVHGSAPRADGTVGVYSVPAILIYPRHRRGNGVGVVDWLNSAFYHFFPATTESGTPNESGTFEFTRLATGNYLFEKGYTYLSIQWNKAVTEIFGSMVPGDGQPHSHLLYGSIERSADAWEILLDAARLLKDPKVYPDADGPARVTTVLSSGYSQGGALQLELLAEGLDPARVYDGHLVQMIGLTCWKRENVAPDYIHAIHRQRAAQAIRVAAAVREARQACRRQSGGAGLHHDQGSEGARCCGQVRAAAMRSRG